MTSTSFQSGQSGGCGAFHSQHILACSTSVNAQGASAALRKVYASEALRVKAFVGQRKFQAPVADDFIRGLRAPGAPRFHKILDGQTFKTASDADDAAAAQLVRLVDVDEEGQLSWETAAN